VLGQNIEKLFPFEPPGLVVAIQSYFVKPQDDMRREIILSSSSKASSTFSITLI